MFNSGMKSGRYIDVSLYLGTKTLGEVRLEALKEEAERQRRSVSDVIILALEEGPSKELQAAFKNAREKFK